MAKGGVTRTIKLGSEDVAIRMSAITPILYNQMIGRDFFADLAKFNDTSLASEREDGLDVNQEVFKGLAYVAVSQASKKQMPKYLDWLDLYSEKDLGEVVFDLLNCWNDNCSGTAVEKNEASE